MFELLQQVRLAVIKPEYLTKVIANFPACKISTGCHQLISNAKLYHSNPSKYNVIDVGEINPRGFPSGKVYVINDHSILQINNCNFREVVKLNTGVIGSRCAAIGQKIYTTGGFRQDHEARSVDIMNQVNVYSPDNNSISTSMPAMNCKRAAHSCCSHAGHLFVSGGKDGQPSTCCEKLIIKDDKWTFVAEMNEARLHFQIVSSGKFIWAIGGEVSTGVLNTTEYYDDVTNKWTKSFPMIQKRSGHSAIAFREYIYVIGGDNDAGHLHSVEKLNVTTKQWTAITSMKDARAAFGCTINRYKLYCFGGSHGLETKVEHFNLYTGDWIEEEEMPIENGLTSAVTIYDV